MKRWVVNITWSTAATGRRTRSATIEADDVSGIFDEDNYPEQVFDDPSLKSPKDITYFNIEVKRA